MADPQLIPFPSPPPAPAKPPTPCRLTEWKPADSATSLVGRATVLFQGGWIVAAIPIFRSPDGQLSPGTPSVPLLDANGTQLRDAAGKRRYEPIIRFDSRAARDRWTLAILSALAQGGIT